MLTPQRSKHAREIPSAPLSPFFLALQASLFGLAVAGAAHAEESTDKEPGSRAVTLPVIQVDADADLESPTGPISGYVARRSITATKTDTPLIETPQSITVIGAQQIEEQKSQNITDALRYSAGVFRSEGIDSTRDQMRVRGFDLDADYGSYFRDGLKYSVNGFNGQQEPYGLERIELLRGASSVLYGLAAPGGIVNTVSKRPSAEPLRELNAEYGGFSRRQISGDFGGALTEDGAWSYRLTALNRKSNTFIDYIPNDRTYIAPALKWQPNAATSLTFLSEYQHDRGTYFAGLPPSGTLTPNINGKLPRHRFLGEPDFDDYDNTRYSVGYLLEHTFNDALKIRHSLRYFHSKNDLASTYIADNYLDATLPDAVQRLLPRWGAERRHDKSSSVTSDTSLQYQWNAGPTAHTTMAGLDYTHTSHQTMRYQTTGDLAPIDVIEPNYGTSLGDFAFSGYSDRLRTNRLGLYAQDQMKVNERWILMLGARQDWTRNDLCTFVNPIGTPDPSTCLRQRITDKAFTGRAGFVYRADNGLAPFASYSTSWEPTMGQDVNGDPFKPMKGKQYEIGIRYQPPGTETSLSATVYHLTRNNVAVADPVDDNIQIQIGEQRSRGLELEATTRLSRNVRVVLAYAYTDAKTTKSSPNSSLEIAEGRRIGGVPRNQFSAWGEYTFGDFGLTGLKAGIGMRYVSSTIGTYVDLQTPSFTLLDAMISYTTGPWRFALNGSNITDKNYLAMCSGSCFYGEPRSVIGSVSYRW
ncbi:TonB-dependent siderophore receptor [Achromobacter sp. SD115]|uniref:TonB-dependent siderophore receptor n=1 Tax=Achromobacter sp. SD115 TaxID=2782011 RepID=UPI001A95D3CE|nr:TonB-dependent siderophore receptor [Achromobacter sp. SD115]MBO1013726.1 TonB-dependent siderophore receptor [Achromobacter sp. SD115]